MASAPTPPKVKALLHGLGTAGTPSSAGAYSLLRAAGAYPLLLLLAGGAGSMVLELAGSRLLAPYFGNTIYLWASQIAVVLAALSFGYYKGGEWADQPRPWARFSRLLLAAGLWTAIAPLIALFSFGLFFPAGPMLGPLLSSLLLFAFPIFVLATITPAVLASLRPDTHHIGRVSGALYALSTAASIAGTLAAGFIIIPQVGVQFIFFFLGAFFVVLSLFRLNRSGRMAAGALVPILVIALLPITSGGQVWAGESAYYHILVVDNSTARSLVMDSDWHSTQYLSNNSLVFEYARAIEAGSTIHGAPAQVLFLGLGAGTLPLNISQKSGVQHVDVVEVDPAVLQTARRFFGFPLSNPHISVFIGDGRQYVRSASQTYDLAVLDAFGSHVSVPYHLLTAEFFGELRSRISPGGLVLFNLISPSRSGLAPHVRAAMQPSFGHVYTYCTSANASSIQNLVILAYDSPPNAPPPAKLADAYLCASSPDSVAPFTDDWAPTDYILATQQ